MARIVFGQTFSASFATCCMRSTIFAGFSLTLMTLLRNTRPLCSFQNSVMAWYDDHDLAVVAVSQNWMIFVISCAAGVGPSAKYSNSPPCAAGGNAWYCVKNDV